MASNSSSAAVLFRMRRAQRPHWMCCFQLSFLEKAVLQCGHSNPARDGGGGVGDGTSDYKKGYQRHCRSRGRCWCRWRCERGKSLPIRRDVCQSRNATTAWYRDGAPDGFCVGKTRYRHDCVFSLLLTNTSE